MMIPENLNNLNYLKCVHLNGQGIREKVDLLEAETTGYDIITVSETWLKEKEGNDQLTLRGYHEPIRRDRPGDQLGGGVAIYVKENLGVNHEKNMDIQGLEAVWATINTGRQKILVSAMYRPPASKALGVDRPSL